MKSTKNQVVMYSFTIICKLKPQIFSYLVIINNVEVLIVVSREEVNDNVYDEYEVLNLVSHGEGNNDAVHEGDGVRRVDAGRDDHATNYSRALTMS